MKKTFCLILVLLLATSLWGCEKNEEVLFFYPRTQVQYGTPDGVIAGEDRELSGMEQDLEYLLKLYLEGPISQDLRSPFPKGTTLVSVFQDESTLSIVFSEAFTRLENMDLTIACACVASTCFGLTEAETVTIAAGETEITLTRDNFALADHSAATTP